MIELLIKYYEIFLLNIKFKGRIMNNKTRVISLPVAFFIRCFIL